VEIGLISAGGPPEMITRCAQVAEAAGYSSIWVPEHVVFFEDYEASYPYAEGGRPPMTTDSNMLEPLNLLSFIAGQTQRIRLGTGVFLLPQRNPVYTAKEATTVDVLSNGRLDLGIGVGWLREEFQAVAVPFEKRGARCDEYIEVIRRLWTGGQVEFSGDYYQLRPCVQSPRPVQRPHPPILVGGVSPPALRRAATLGDGWVAINLDPAEAASQIEQIAAMRREAGLEMQGFRTSMMAVTFHVEPEDLPRYRDAGIEQLVLAPMRRDRVIRGAEELYALIEELARDFVERARTL